VERPDAHAHCPIGIFTSDGSDWQHSREMLRPNFVRSQVGDVATFEKHVSHLISAIPPNTTVDLSDFFFRLTIDSATEFLFGESTESLTQQSSDGFAEAFTHSQDYIANSSRWGAWAKLFPANGRFNKDRKLVHDFVDYYVKTGLSRRNNQSTDEKSDQNERYVFLDSLVKQEVDPIRIRSELLNILLAGRDTTASLLTNVWFTLGKRPDIWEKLQAEVATLHGQKPTFEQLKDLKYLKVC
jgi:cytochrome P450